MEAKLIPLEMLLRWLWADNPKLHQDVLIQFSINEYGFNDRVGVCSKFELILEGHGRLGILKRMKDLWLQKDPNTKMPTNVVEDPVLGDWLIPCDDHDQFESREQAYAYALQHNRSGVTALDLRDYDVGKLQRAIKSASLGKQIGFELPGFGSGDFTDASTSIGVPGAAPGGAAGNGPIAAGALPKTAIFDPTALPDTPGYQENQAPQSYVAMVTAPDATAFQRVLSALTLGERRKLPEGARFALVESGKYIQEWEKYLIAKETLVVPADLTPESIPLAGQITLAGDVVADPSDLASTTLVTGLSPAKEVDYGQMAEAVAVPEPAWDADGNCTKCLGKGFTSNKIIAGQVMKVYCTVCEGHATETVWKEAKGVAT